MGLVLVSATGPVVIFWLWYDRCWSWYQMLVSVCQMLVTVSETLLAHTHMARFCLCLLTHMGHIPETCTTHLHSHGPLSFTHSHMFVLYINSLTYFLCTHVTLFHPCILMSLYMYTHVFTHYHRNPYEHNSHMQFFPVHAELLMDTLIHTIGHNLPVLLVLSY